VLREERLDEVRQLIEVAEELDVTTAQLALAWCRQNLDVSTVITGASKPHRVAENTQALNLADKIDGAVEERIEEILDNKPRPNKTDGGKSILEGIETRALRFFCRAVIVRAMYAPMRQSSTGGDPATRG